MGNETQPSATPAGSPAIQLALLGGFRVVVAGRVIDPAAWRLDKARSLVKLLALAPGHQLGRDRIMDLLWPELGPVAAANNFYQALHAARRALTLGDATPVRDALLHFQHQMLSLHPPDAIVVDVAAFETAATLARRTRAPTDYEAAIARYGGELLPEDRYEDWATSRREALHEVFLALLVDVALLYEDRGASAEASAVLARAVAEEPAHEAAHVGLMRLFARGGQRQRALQQYAQLRTALRRDLEAEPDPATERLYREILARRFPASALPPAASPPLPPDRHNLPLSLTSFFGRADDAATITRLLNTTRLLTLTGAGGCGKTRLALAVATPLVPAYADGVWLVALAALADPALLIATVAAALGVREEPGQPLAATLVAALRTRTLLLVLDNCEHLIDACGALATRLLGACPHLRILATSRETLHAPGELVWRVSPLPAPPGPIGARPGVLAPRAVADLARYAAVALFVDRARWRQPAFTLAIENAVAVAAICRQLDGLPLALELAAAQMPTLTVAQIAARLGDATHLLARGGRTGSTHQQTLALTLEWSYALLPSGEQHLLRRLAVCAGGFDLAAAEALAPDAAGALLSLAALVDKSLVEVQAEGEEARYRFLETVRQDAQARLIASGEAERVRECHAAHYLALAEAAASALEGPAQARWLDRLEREHDNLNAALAWSAGAGGDRAGAAATGLRLAGALWRFWLMRGYPGEGGRWLERFLAAPSAPSPERAKALAGAGALAHSQGDYPRAAARTAESLVLWRGLADQVGIAGALGTLAMVRKAQGDYPLASGLFAEALALWRTLGQPLKAAMVLNNLGALAYDQGAHDQAEGFLTESLAIKRDAGDRQGIASTLINLAEGARFRGDYARATVLLAESLALFRTLGNTPRIAHILNSLGVVACAQRDHARAAALLRESLSLFRDLGNRWGITLGVEALALLAADRGDAAPAARLLGAAAGLRAALGFPLPPVERAGYDGALATLRAALGATTFAASWNAGQALAPDVAIEEALRVGQSPEATLACGARLLPKRSC